MAVLPPRLIRIPKGARSSEVASFFAQLDELSGRMLADMKDAKPAELAWQPKRGQNTIGMLLAHCAIVEAFWLLLATGVKTSVDADRRLPGAIDIAMDADGMPADADAKPPRSLAGWNFARFRKLHDHARKFAKRRAARLKPADLARVLRLVRPNGDIRVVSPRWILYHVLEHQAGHYGQMLLLRHQYRDRGKK